MGLRTLFLLLLASFAPLFGADKTRLAAMPLVGKTGVEPAVVEALADLLATELVKIRKFDCVDRANLQKVLREQAFQQTGCTEQACAVRLGNLLNVQKIVVGSVSKLGATIILTVNIIDVERGRIDLAERESATALEAFIEKVANLVAKIDAREPMRGRLTGPAGGGAWLCNLGADDGVRAGDLIQVVRFGDAIIDPANGEFMGRKMVQVGLATVASLDPGGMLSTLQPVKTMLAFSNFDALFLRRDVPPPADPPHAAPPPAPTNTVHGGDAGSLTNLQATVEPGSDRRRIEVAGVSFTLCRIPAGSFLMGSPESEQEEAARAGAMKDWVRQEVQHPVTLTRDFWLGQAEVTQELWRAVLGSDPSPLKGDRLPVESVTWEDAARFCQELSKKTGLRFRLPTEAEWEYACRAGTTSPFHFGEDLDSTLANFDGSFPFGNGAAGIFRRRAVEVMSFPPNAWGLHDMHGNVWEWCQDWHGDGYYREEGARGPDPQGPSSGSSHVLRGGSWYFFAADCRSAFRAGPSQDSRYSAGLRVALETARNP